MTEVHGLIYILVGAAVALYSWFLDKEKFFLFVVLGCFFVLIGVVKLIFKRGKSLHKVHHKMTSGKQQNFIQTVEHNIAGYCHSCGSAIRHFDNFCGRCGQRIFRKKL